jgi:integrase
LRFKDFDFKDNVIRIAEDTKTGAREVPLFAEIREVFEQFIDKRDKKKLPIDFIFDDLTCFCFRLVSAIRAAKVEVWKKLFVNLRSSCITDLAERGCSEKTLDAIFGNSALVRNRHYIQFRKDGEYSKVLQDDERLLKLSRSETGLDIPDDILLQKIRRVLLSNSSELGSNLVSLKTLVNEFDAEKPAA